MADYVPALFTIVNHLSINIFKEVFKLLKFHKKTLSIVLVSMLAAGTIGTVAAIAALVLMFFMIFIFPGYPLFSLVCQAKAQAP